jgi:hypothetical protein
MLESPPLIQLGVYQRRSQERNNASQRKKDFNDAAQPQAPSQFPTSSQSNAYLTLDISFHGRLSCFPPWWLAMVMEAAYVHFQSMDTKPTQICAEIV